MRDIQVKIFRPVAMPKQFAGAPEGPAFINIAINTIFFFVASVADLPMPIAIIFLMIVVHVMLISLYSREPHLTTLMNTFNATRRKARSIGPTHDADYNP